VSAEAYSAGQFSNISISQGSVLTRLMGGGIVNDRFSRFSAACTSDKLERRSIFGEDMNKSSISCFFRLTVYIYRRSDYCNYMERRFREFSRINPGNLDGFG